MTRIGLLSDTHAWWDDRYAHYFSECDEVWHAGDIGSAELADRFEQLPVTFRAVYGNIDGYDIRLRYPEVLRFTVEGIDVLMKHIGGYPGKYDSSVRSLLFDNPPRLFVCGHSHIMKVKYDKTLGLLHINPGAAGVYGIQAVRTLVRFTLADADIRDLEVIELH
ncbi:MAG: metallophosphoesterase family protein [Bacteroidaceae bacterium]|nr:metallophosphoesterase family protein [Bacteroidaceae bacterium]